MIVKSRVIPTNSFKMLNLLRSSNLRKERDALRRMNQAINQPNLNQSIASLRLGRKMIRSKPKLRKNLTA